MDDYLAKPIAAAELFRAIDRVLAGRPAAEPEPPVRGRPETLLDPATLLAACDDDPTLLRKLIQVFRADAPGALARVREAVDQQDAPRLREAAHRLRGLLSTLLGDGRRGGRAARDDGGRRPARRRRFDPRRPGRDGGAAGPAAGGTLDRAVASPGRRWRARVNARRGPPTGPFRCHQSRSVADQSWYPGRSVRSLRFRCRPGPPSSIVGRASKLSSRQRAGSGVEGPDRGAREPLRGDESDRRRTPARALRVMSRSRGSTTRGERRDGRINDHSAAARGGGPPVRPRLRLLPQPGGGVSRAPPPDEGGVPNGEKRSSTSSIPSIVPSGCAAWRRSASARLPLGVPVRSRSGPGRMLTSGADASTKRR